MWSLRGSHKPIASNLWIRNGNLALGWNHQQVEWAHRDHSRWWSLFRDSGQNREENATIEHINATVKTPSSHDQGDCRTNSRKNVSSVCRCWRSWNTDTWRWSYFRGQGRQILPNYSASASKIRVQWSLCGVWRRSAWKEACLYNDVQEKMRRSHEKMMKLIRNESEEGRRNDRKRS